MSKLLIVTFMAFAALAADAQSKMSRGAAKGKDAKVLISRKAQLGSVCIQNAPSANGSTNMKVSRRARQWIVPELEYQTAADWLDQLTVTWHILLDSKSAKLRDKPPKDDKPPVPRYSYYTVAVRYVNISKGPHGASVVLPPSVLERFGEPAIIAAVLTNGDGDVLDFQNEGASQLFGKVLSKDPRWWENNDIIGATDKNGNPLIARRQGLVDRSKTVFALVNADDYEMVHQ